MKRTLPNLFRVQRDAETDHSRLIDGPCTSTTVESEKQLFWRPRIDEAGNLWDEDLGDDEELDMQLGSSILFDNKELPEEVYIQEVQEFEPYENEEAPKKDRRRSPNLIRHAVNDLFKANMHPRPAAMLELSENYKIRYRSVFLSMERKRASRGIECEEGDICRRIKQWMKQENGSLKWTKMSPETKELLETELEVHVLNRIRLDLGVLHVILEKTNLAAPFVRAQYTKWRNRLLAPDRPDYTIQQWRSDSTRLHESLPLETLRRLEDVYLTKKYESEDKEWSQEEVRELSEYLDGLPENTIRVWLEKRDGAVGSFPRGTKREFAVVPSKAVPLHKAKVLEEEFEKKNLLTKREVAQLAEQLELRDRTVVNYFSKLRKRKRKDEHWETAKEEVISMTPEQIQLLEEVAAERRKTSLEYLEIAERIGVSYHTLCSFVDRKKSRKTKRYSELQFDAV